MDLKLTFLTLAAFAFSNGTLLATHQQEEMKKTARPLAPVKEDKLTPELEEGTGTFKLTWFEESTTSANLIFKETGESDEISFEDLKCTLSPFGFSLEGSMTKGKTRDTFKFFVSNDMETETSYLRNFDRENERVFKPIQRASKIEFTDKSIQDGIFEANISFEKLLGFRKNFDGKTEPFIDIKGRVKCKIENLTGKPIKDFPI